MAGLRPAAILFLVRHPGGSIASHVRGVKKGAMGKIDDNQKRMWYQENKESSYINESGFTEDRLASMDDAEFLALQWRIYHDDLLRYHNLFSGVQFFSYESFVKDPEASVMNLFSCLNIEPDEGVFRFVEESSSKGRQSIRLTQKDASDEYYSVYREASYDPQSWSKDLSEDDLQLIDQHTSSVYKAIMNLL